MTLELYEIILFFYSVQRFVFRDVSLAIVFSFEIYFFNLLHVTILCYLKCISFLICHWLVTLELYEIIFFSILFKDLFSEAYLG